MFGGKPVEVGRLFGIRICADLSWFIIAALVTWNIYSRLIEKVPDQPFLLYLMFAFFLTAGVFASVLIHELSHCFVARRFGIVFSRITLCVFGAIATSNTKLSKLSAKSEFWFTLAGPLSNFCLVALLAAPAFLLPKNSLWFESALMLLYINMILGLFNLLPCLPMDGGRILRATLWWRTGNLQKATTIAFGVAITTSAALLTFLIFTRSIGQLFWIGALLLFIIPSAYDEYRMIHKSRH